MIFSHLPRNMVCAHRTPESVVLINLNRLHNTFMTSKFNFFDSLVGYEYDFYGVDNNTFCIGVDGHRCAFEAHEDPEDGWRSHLSTVEVSTTDQVYFSESLGRTILDFYEDYDFIGYVVRDVTTGHEWLKFGTDHTDEYYPLFTFAYRVMMPATSESDNKQICVCETCEKKRNQECGQQKVCECRY